MRRARYMRRAHSGQDARISPRPAIFRRARPAAAGGRDADGQMIDAFRYDDDIDFDEARDGLLGHMRLQEAHTLRAAMSFARDT